jgi:hypothetical protein
LAASPAPFFNAFIENGEAVGLHHSEMFAGERDRQALDRDPILDRLARLKDSGHRAANGEGAPQAPSGHVLGFFRRLALSRQTGDRRECDDADIFLSRFGDRRLAGLFGHVPLTLIPPALEH